MNNEEPDEEKMDSSVLQYIKATTAASERARTVIIVMVVASVVVFTQIRNDDGWLDRRINVRIYALRLLSDIDQEKEISSKPLNKQGVERDWYERAQKFINQNNYSTNDKAKANDIERLKGELGELVKLRAENMRLVRLPFFGAVYDANDTVIFAGITFSVVLLWLTLALNRERRNIEITFRAAKSQQKSRLCYDLLAMRQVLTVPPTTDGTIWKAISYATKALYIMPLLVYGWLLALNWINRERAGDPLGWDKVHRAFASGGLFFAVILCLTLVCLFTSLILGRDWARYAKQAEAENDASEL